MLFNSIDFALFLPIVFVLYWFVCAKNIKLQNILIVVASYTFYGWWDWRFLSLIFFSTVVDYFVGKGLDRYQKISTRRLLLWISIFVNLGFLGFFKYYNFFLDNFIEAFSFFGKEISPSGLNIILPVGISFYTFQTMSYSIDVYKKKMKATDDFISFTAFVSFFPQLVAGPIERATHLLPQFYKKRTFDYNEAVKGLYQVVWGLFKKVVIADNCAQYANDIFSNYSNYSSLTLILGAVYFAFQIYGDFSGYSDIAIGTSRLFGFSLMRNFAFPYFSRDIAEFWRRWHISLSTWFRDYLYIPLGGSRGSTLMKVRNIFIIFIVSGFWHGANWTFIIWGFLNALYFLPLLLSKQNRSNLNSVAEGRLFPSIKEAIQVVSTFSLTVFAWIFFRADSVQLAFDYIGGILKLDFTVQHISLERYAFELLPILFILICIEWKYRFVEIPFFSGKRAYLGLLFLLLMIVVIGNYSNMQSFIYFQF